MRKFLIAGLMTAAAAPLLAQAAPVAPMADKAVTRAEVDAKVRTHFARLDANRDGSLTTDEMTAMRAARMAKREARQPGERRMRDPNAAFDRLDLNRDGAISRTEFAQAREARAQKRAAPGAGRHHGAGGMGMMGGHMLKMADANRDGRVTLGEATAGAARHFDMVDTNRDGSITRDERRAARGLMRQMRVRQPG